MLGVFSGTAVGLTAYSVANPMDECSEWVCERIPLIRRIVVAVHEYGFDERYADARDWALDGQDGADGEGAAPYLSSKTDGRGEAERPRENGTNGEESPQLPGGEAPDGPPRPLETPALASPALPVHSSMQGLAECIQKIEEAARNPEATDELKRAVECLRQEAHSLDRFLQDIDSESSRVWSKKLAEQEGYFRDLLEVQEKALQTQMENQETHWISALLHEYERLEMLYRERLLEALKRQEEVNEKRLKNELIQQAIELQRRWMREMKARVEEQRGGRLGQLEHLYRHLKHLEMLLGQTRDFSENMVHVQRLQIASQALRRVIEDPQQKPFAKELNALKDLCKDDEFMQLAVASIQSESCEQGIMSKTQLIHRFRHLAQEIHKVSLCPDHTGVLGYVLSRFLTFFMFRKTAFTDGNHVHHILARAEAHLEKNNLDAATRELNQLTGIPRKLAKDWIKYARQNLEVLQALYMIETYTMLQSILFA